MKMTTICAVAGLAIASLGTETAASAQDRAPAGNQDGRQPGMRSNQGSPNGSKYQDQGRDGVRDDHGPGRGPGYGNHGANFRGGGHHQRCRTVMHHHNRVRRSY